MVLEYTITVVSVLTFPDTSVLFCIEAESFDFVTGALLLQALKKMISNIWSSFLASPYY